MQSLPALDKDTAVFDDASKTYNAMNTIKDGVSGVSAARGNAYFRMTIAPASAAAGANVEQMRSFSSFADTAAPADAKAESSRMQQYMQQQRFVNGRNFFQNGNQWVDSTLQDNQSAKRVRIQFNSTEYFDLISKEPQALSWLALGNNVQFVLSGTIYEIYE